MGRSSCISEPENEPLIVVKKWMADITLEENGKANNCAAGLVAFFKYFHEVKIEIVAKNMTANDVAEKHGDKRINDESLYQFHTIEDLQDRLVQHYSKNTIRSAITLLIEKGIIQTFANPNPRYKFDKTTFFLFFPEKCNELIRKRRSSKTKTIVTQNWSIDGSDLNDRRIKNDPASIKFDLAIPKTTNKTTEKAAAIMNSPQELETDVEQKPDSAAAFPVEENKKPVSQLIANADLVIAETLTAEQKQHAMALSAELNSTIPSLGATVEDIETILLNANCFAKAKRDFFKKLNTIRSQALKGNWSPPKSVQDEQAKVDAKTAEHKAISDELARLQIDKHSIKCALKSKLAMTSPAMLESYRVQLAEVEKAIARLIDGDVEDSETVQGSSICQVRASDVALSDHTNASNFSAHLMPEQQYGLFSSTRVNLMGAAQ